MNILGCSRYYNDITLSLKTMKNFNRYGFAKVNENSQVVAFEEKKYQETGHIDGGIYAIKRTIFDGYKTQN